MSLAQFLLSIFGAALNLYLLGESRGPKPLYALVTVMLILRSVKYGAKLLEEKP